MGRTPQERYQLQPRDEQRERTLIATLLYPNEDNPDKDRRELFDAIDPEKDIYQGPIREMFNALKAMDSEGHPITRDTFLERIRVSGRNGLVTKALKVTDGFDNPPTGMLIADFIAEIKRVTRKRELWLAHGEEAELWKRNASYEEILEHRRKVDDENLRHQAGRIQLLTLAEMAVDIREEPPPPDFSITLHGCGIAERGAVTLISGAGGVGKTRLVLQLAVALARGQDFGPFASKDRLRALVLSAEDSPVQIERRLYSEVGIDQVPGLYVASTKGIKGLGPLVRVEGEVAMTTPSFDWLERTIELCAREGLDLVVLDPKSHFCGIPEIANHLQTGFIARMGDLAVRHQVAIVMTTHVSQMAIEHGRPTQTATRGGTGQVDSARNVVTMLNMSEKDAELLGVDPRQWARLDVVKSNIDAKPRDETWFKWSDAGRLEPGNPYYEKLDRWVPVLARILGDEQQQGRNYTKNELIRSPQCQPIFAQMREEFGERFRRKKELGSTIGWGIKTEILEIVTIEAGRTKQPREEIHVRLFC